MHGQILQSRSVREKRKVIGQPTLLRSPDRVIGFGDAMRGDTHFQSFFTLADRFSLMLETYDSFYLVVCLL